jgi:hypothetical protein
MIDAIPPKTEAGKFVRNSTFRRADIGELYICYKMLQKSEERNEQFEEGITNFKHTKISKI